MVKFDSRYFNNAHRISVPLAATVTGDFYDGQWFVLGTGGKAVLADGTTNTHAYMTISSRYGTGNGVGVPITDAPAGRDTVTPSGQVILLIGPYALTTDQYETGVYALGAALKVSSDGKLTPWASATDSAADIVGYVTKVPTASDATLGFIHE